MTRLITLILAAALFAACNDGNDDAATKAPAADASAAPDSQVEVSAEANSSKTKSGPLADRTSKLGPPVRIDYRVIGEPIVGQPVAVDLQIESSLGTQTLDLSYRVNDSTALSFPETQAMAVALSPALGIDQRGLAAQQVNVIPLREGRLFLNVAVSIETDTGSWSSVTAVPIQVGQAPRELLENGTVTTDEDGELIRVLPAE